ncbi:peptidylprolyl isomerase [Maribellus maritimus]|uniref:peptidylprolyl isomerase n=1 Tax=Maribellus maritimus TaxID=2870838 RepID=UPI001EECDA09|nr:peptidylprolyl isomerase [Maribellus maritimus]MCG6187206.1 peptidylprolyl isomerase [Maribellus maritimus]
MRKILFLALFSFSFFIGVAQPLPQVIIETSMGNIVAELDTLNAPITAKNFLNLVKTGVLNNAVFYRVVRMDNQPNNKIKIEVVQGGLFDDERIAKYPPIQHETTKMTGLKHLNGTLSMARYEPGTASTEFSICIGDQPELDFGGKRNPDGQGFAAFGRVLSGMDVAKRIQMQKDNKQYLVETVPIYSIKIL